MKTREKRNERKGMHKNKETENRGRNNNKGKRE